MRNTIGLVGVGSLGGFLANQIQSHVDTMYVIDPDSVEEKNLRNSIYHKLDINKPKVYALKSKITKCDLVPVKARFEDIDLPSVNNFIDCRDIVNRNIRTDVKFLIVGRNLRVDCEEPSMTTDEPGNYLIELSKQEVSKAAHLASKVLLSERIKELQDDKSSINLPISTKSVDSEMKFHIKQKTKPLLQRDISSHIFNEIKDISDPRGFVRTRLCKLDDQKGILTFEPSLMQYPAVITALNDVVLRDNGTYFIDKKNRFIEICYPTLDGGA